MSGLVERLTQRPTDLDPFEFAVRFTRTMRRQRTASHIPSLRTSVAIPRWLAARALRVGTLTPIDYVIAAVRCTPPDDQDLAEAVARSIVFPEASSHEAPTQAPTTTDPHGNDDPLASVLGDLEALDLDLGALDDLADAAMALESDASLGAFELFERLYSSADSEERALGELVHGFGGPAELEADGVNTVLLAQVWAAKRLLAAVGELSPVTLAHGVTAGFGPELRRACTQPWEVAGVLAAESSADLDAHLQDLLQSGSIRDLGRTIAFLGPHPHAEQQRSTFADAALARALTLWDFAELVVGLGEWVDPPADILDASIAVQPRRTMEAAEWLERTFGIDLRPDVFDRWYASRSQPGLGELALMAAPCDAWDRAVDRAVPLETARFESLTGSSGSPISAPLQEAVTLARVLKETELEAGHAAATELATAAMVGVPVASWFLPLLDAFLEPRVVPRLEPVLARAIALGVPEEEVLDRLGEAIEQLRLLVLDDSEDAARYARLIPKIMGMPEDLVRDLCAQAAATGNLTAMAALLGVDLGAASAHLTDEQVTQALGHKGIGGGPNVLRQWFRSRDRLRASLRAPLKAFAKAALLDAALDWAGSQGGSGRQGLIPQQRTRPFRAGDGLDRLDLDSTLEAIVASGKSLDAVTEEDLFASETARGNAALAVLIDISGSMGAGELAVCAIAVVMLLGRMLPEELALAVFENDTHVIKGFTDPADLDDLADEVLDMRAAGGTRVDAALSWATDAFATVHDAEVRVLFLLSDFAFAEDPGLLRQHGTRLREHGARLLAASHGYVDRVRLTDLLESMGGEHLDMKRLDRLPQLLLDSLQRLGD